MRVVTATEMKVGDVMLLPMGQTATVTSVRIGTKFVNFVTEHGPSRVKRTDEVLLEDE